MTKELMPHQQLVVEEKAQLDDRLEKLNVFMAGSMFQTLAEAERDRLARQAHAMTDYSLILSERIRAFGDEA